MISDFWFKRRTKWCKLRTVRRESVSFAGKRKLFSGGAAQKGMMLTPLDLFLRICFAGFSAILFSVSVMAYRRHQEMRLAIVSVAFGLFLLLALLVLASSFLGWSDLEMSPALVIIDLAILITLYVALLKR